MTMRSAPEYKNSSYLSKPQSQNLDENMTVGIDKKETCIDTKRLVNHI